MTSAAATLSEPALTSRRAAWGTKATEFLLVGGATLVLYPLAWLLRQALGLDAAELGVGFLMFHAAFLINDPHFAVTYLLFYSNVRERALGRTFDRAQRFRYWVAGLVVPAALATWMVAALSTGSAALLGSMMELMFLLVGWHYVKQGFGVLSVLSARRGVVLGALERRVILAHCYAGFAYAWTNPAAPARQVEEKGVVYVALAHPPELELVAGAVFFASALALVWVVARKWQREQRTVPLAPLSVLLVTVWLWTVYSSIDPLMVYVIPALHSLQYLYFVWLLKRNQAREAEGPPSFGKPAPLRLALFATSTVAFAWLLLHGGPGLLDAALIAPNAAGREASLALGPTPYVAAFFAFVNIHHYFMDTVIWRRQNPETRYLRADSSSGHARSPTTSP